MIEVGTNTRNRDAYRAAHEARGAAFRATVRWLFLRRP